MYQAKTIDVSENKLDRRSQFVGVDSQKQELINGSDSTGSNIPLSVSIASSTVQPNEVLELELANILNTRSEITEEINRNTKLMEALRIKYVEDKKDLQGNKVALEYLKARFDAESESICLNFKDLYEQSQPLEERLRELNKLRLA